MKKFFKILALASIAMVGMLVSSCQVDDIVTAFEPNAATSTILVKVYDQATGNYVTQASQITASNTANLAIANEYYNAEKDEYVIEYKGNKALSAMTVTVSATYKDYTGIDEFDVRAVLPGGHAIVPSVVLIAEHPGPTPEIWYSLERGETEEGEPVVGTFNPRGHEGHSHDGSVWAINETEFALIAKFNWSYQYGTPKSEIRQLPTPEMRDDEWTLLQGYISTNIPDWYEEGEMEEEFKISAFAMYTLFATQTVDWTHYDFVRYETVGEEVLPPVTIATLEVPRISTQWEYMEKAIPGHEGHYHEGHGLPDTHGYSNNAGGGIVWGE